VDPPEIAMRAMPRVATACSTREASSRAEASATSAGEDQT